MTIELVNNAGGAALISGCESTSDGGTWAGGGYAVEANGDGNQHGTNCLQWGCATGVTILEFTPTTAFDLLNNELGFWFLLPKSNADNASPVLSATANSLRVRVFTGAAYADFYIGSDDTLPGGWQWIRIGGNNYDGTMSGTVNFSSIDKIGIYTNNANINNDSKGDAYYKVDMVCLYRKIIVKGYNTAVGPSEPWTPESIYQLCRITKDDTNNLKTPDDGYWGMIEKADIYYEYFPGIEYGDGTNAGAFLCANAYMYFNPFSEDIPTHQVMKANFAATWGRKNDAGTFTYAQDGGQLVCRPGMSTRPNITVESGGEWNAYASYIRGWGTINFGAGGASPIEFIKTDIHENNTLEFRSTLLDFTDVEMHFPDGSEAAIGTVYNAPSNLDGIRVYQVTDGLAFRVNATVQNARVGDATYHWVILEGVTLTAIDSVFDASKMKRLAA